MDIHFVREAMENELVRGFLAKLANDEIIPIVPPVPNTSVADYFKLIERRFRNPKIADTIPRLAQDVSNRQPKFILPSTADRLARNEDVIGLALVSAFWCRFLTGKSDSGKDITLYETSADRLVPAALKATEDPMAFLVFEDIFGEVGKSELFRKRFAHGLKTLWDKGTKETLQLYIDGELAS
jgi:mannitol 2-dehydrogenase